MVSMLPSTKKIGYRIICYLNIEAFGDVLQKKYKAAYPGLPRGFQLPKELARELADLLNEGKSIDEAVDEMPELDYFVDDHNSE